MDRVTCGSAIGCVCVGAQRCAAGVRIVAGGARGRAGGLKSPAPSPSGPTPIHCESNLVVEEGCLLPRKCAFGFIPH